MKILYVFDVPDHLYKRLQQFARSKNRSLNARIITMLFQAVEEEHLKEQAKILTSIQQRRFKAPKNAPSSLELLQEDRGR